MFASDNILFKETVQCKHFHTKSSVFLRLQGNTNKSVICTDEEIQYKQFQPDKGK